MKQNILTLESGQTWVRSNPQAKCEYCGRYGPLGQCQGCGAPTRPIRRIEVTAVGDAHRRYIEVLE